MKQITEKLMKRARLIPTLILSVMALWATVDVDAAPGRALDAVRAPEPAVRLEIELPGGRVLAELERIEVFTPNATFVAQTADGPVEVARPDVVVRYGRVAGSPDSFVVVSATSDRVWGFVDFEGKRYDTHAGSTENEERLIAQDLTHLKAGLPERICLNHEFPPQFSGPGEDPLPDLKGATNTIYEIEMAVDIGHLAVNHFGSVTEALEYATSLLGAVSAIYLNDLNTVVTVPFAHVWEVEDPYSDTNAAGAIIDFKQYWNANMDHVQRDVAHLLDTLVAPGGKGYLRALCATGPSATGYAASGIRGHYAYPHLGYTWDADVVSHELGHNVGSVHTHCYNPPIDRCYNAEPFCHDGERIMQQGTIMSYCHLAGGTKVLDFHDRVRTRLRAQIENEACVTPYVGCAIGLSPLPFGRLGEPYSESISATGGVGTYTFQVTAGTLPGGLTLSSGGVLSGTPTVLGLRNYTVTVTDSAGCSSFRIYHQNIYRPCAVTVSPAELPDAEVGTPYSVISSPGGGNHPYLFERTSGSLPPGIDMTERGRFEGTPTTEGTSLFSVRVTDVSGCIADLDYELHVASGCGSLDMSPITLPDGSTDSSYAQQLTGTGGVAPYTFSATGALPPGLSLSSNGSLAGDPSSAGVFPFVVEVEDADGCVGSRSYSIEIQCPPITVGPPTLPAGTAKTFYDQEVWAGGGTSRSFVFDVFGILPPGLALTGFGPTSRISGTPTTPGTYRFTVVATSAAGGCSGFQSYILVID